jgi:hypothetical protein
MMLVTVDEAKERLRVIHDEDDDDLEMMIRGTSAAVLRYLRSDGAEFVTSDGDLHVPDDVQLAVLMLTGILFRDRDGTEAKDWEHGFLPKPVIALLYPLRDPAMG